MIVSNIPFPDRQDIREAEGRVKLLLEFNVKSGQAIAAQWVVPGDDMTAEMICFKSDLKYVKDCTETKFDDVKQAQKSHERKKRRWLVEHCLAEKIINSESELPEDESMWPMMAHGARFQYWSRMYNGSVEREFFDQMGRGILPLKAYHVIDENVAPPMTPEQLHAKAIVDAGRSPVSEVSELRDKIARLEALLDTSKQRTNK